MTKNRKPLKRSFLIGIMAFVMIVCVVLSSVQFLHYRAMLYSTYENYIENILNYAAGEIDVDDLEECMRTGEKSPRFEELQKALDGIRDRVNIHFIYVIVPLNTNETDNIRNVIAGVSQYEYENMADVLVQLNQLTGDSYSPETAKKYLDAYDSGKLSFFEEISQWGDDYTGLLPLYDSSGNKVAALCVDVDVTDIHTALWRNTLSLVVITLLLGLVFAALFYTWASRTITKPIEQLEVSVARFAKSCEGQKDPEALRMDVPEIQTANEVESLASAVKTMGKAMQDYAKSIVLTESELARLTVLANKDALTQVRNKTAYDAFAIDLQAKVRQGGFEYALLMLDLNLLKKINDTYGHEKGDLYIQYSCALICKLFSHSPVFRVGGDEFVVVLQGQDYENRLALVEKAKETFDDSARNEAAEPWERCSVAIGMAEYDGSAAQTVDEVLNLADREMYSNKMETHGTGQV